MSIFENTVMVTRRPSYGQLFAKYLFIVLAVVCGVGTLIISPLGLIVPTILFVVFAYLMMGVCDVELEYTYIEGELAIDKIKAKRKRKKIAKIDLEDLILIAPAGSGELNSYYQSNDLKKIDATSKKADRKIYDLVYRHNNSNEIISFEPDQNMLDAIRVKHMRKVIL